MAFADCLISARDQGELSDAEMEYLKTRYDEHVEAAGGTDDPRGPEGVARDRLVRDLADDAARKKRLAQLTADRTEAILNVATDYRPPGKDAPDVVEAFMGVLENRNALLLGAPSVVGRRDALLGLWHGALAEQLYAFRRGFVTGGRWNALSLDRVIDEAFGQGSGDALARSFYQAWTAVAEQARQAFNRAGGAIAQLKDWGLPQRHDAVAIMAAGRDAWKAYIAPRLDIARMLDPLTGGPLTAARLESALDAIYERIVTDGAIDITPSGQAQGRGALANQRQEHRFLVFKDATSWREYHVTYGGNDIYGAMMSHLEMMAKDVAAMEVLGPNPNATVEWMTQVVRHEAALSVTGQPSLYANVSKAEELMRGGDVGTGKIRRLWTVVNGSAGTGSLFAADVMGTVRNTLTAAQLAGAAVTAVASDPFTQSVARAFAGTSRLRYLAEVPRLMASRMTRVEVHRAGIIFDDAMEHLSLNLRREALAQSSHELSRWLPERTFTWTGLTGWTNTGRRAAGLEFMFSAADNSGETLRQLEAAGGRSANFARTLRGFGVDDAMWDTIRVRAGTNHGPAGRMIRPVDVAAVDREAALRYSEALHGFLEEATPKGTARARAALGRSTASGTLLGEGTRSLTMYLSYPTTALMSQMRMIAHEGGLRSGRGLSWAASATLTLTVGGMLAYQLAELRNGRDPVSLTDPTNWVKAAIRGGALGFYGDYLMADYKRGSTEAAARFAGPVAGLVGDALALANPNALIADEDANRGRQAVKMLRSYVPFARMWWLRPVSERMIYDRLQLLADPNAYESWQRTANQLQSTTGQGEWWKRGQSEPDRAPDMSNLFR